MQQKEAARLVHKDDDVDAVEAQGHTFAAGFDGDGIVQTEAQDLAAQAALLGLSPIPPGSGP